LNLIGLEKEFFIVNADGKPLTATQAGITERDGCGYLAEARGEPKESIVSAVFSLKEAEFKLTRIAQKKGVSLQEIPYKTLPKAFTYACAREFGKGIAKDACMYGAVKQNKIATAGLHIHFSSTSDSNERCKCGEWIHTRSCKTMDMPRIIKALDKRFYIDIKWAKRQLGLYEMKPYGFEYRSLPNNIPLTELSDFIEDFNANPNAY